AHPRLAPSRVLGAVHLAARGTPGPRDLVGVVDPDVCRSGPAVGRHDSEMDLDTIARGKAVSAAVVLACGESQPPTVRQGDSQVPQAQDRPHPFQRGHEPTPYRDGGGTALGRLWHPSGAETLAKEDVNPARVDRTWSWVALAVGALAFMWSLRAYIIVALDRVGAGEVNGLEEYREGAGT